MPKPIREETLQGNEPITIRLTAEKWNQVLALLAEGPFRVAAPLISEIREQALAQGAAPGNGSGAEEKRVSN